MLVRSNAPTGVISSKYSNAANTIKIIFRSCVLPFIDSYLTFFPLPSLVLYVEKSVFIFMMSMMSMSINAGSRRVFGTVVETKVAVLVDISGSMMTYLDELKHELASLIWDQLYPQKVR